MYAIVITGGKQYRVSENDVIEVEKLKAEPGATVELDVAFIADGANIITDQATLATAKVFATVVEHFKGVKALVFKFQKRKGYKRTRGHRQELTRLRIAEISLSGKESKKSAKSAEKPTKPEAKAAVDKETEPAKKAKSPTKSESATKAVAAKKTAKSADEAAKATTKTSRAKSKVEKTETETVAE